MIKRGFKTVYNYNSKKDEVRFGATRDIEWDFEGNTQFEIVGTPPPKGTRVLILFQRSGNLENGIEDTFASVYQSLDDIHAMMDKPDLSEDRNLDLFVDVYFDNNQDDIYADNPEVTGDTLIKLVIEDAKKYLFDMLEDDELDPTFRIKEVELP